MGTEGTIREQPQDILLAKINAIGAEIVALRARADALTLEQTRLIGQWAPLVRREPVRSTVVELASANIERKRDRALARAAHGDIRMKNILAEMLYGED